MNLFNIDNVCEKINKAHPKQMIIDDNVSTQMMFFEIKYNYITKRKNKREGIKYIVINTFNPQIDIGKTFFKWVEDFNLLNEHRQISNVKILESHCLGYINI